MNATEDGHPLGESPAVDGCTVCRTEPARAVEGHRVCVSHEGIATELADLKRRVGEAESSDPLDAIRRLSGLGMLQGADKLAATEQLAERQAQALNVVRDLHSPCCNICKSPCCIVCLADPVRDYPCDRRGRRMTAPERPVSEQARDLADQLQAVVDQLPTYAARTPDLSIGFGIRLSRLVERLAKQVEALQ